MKIIFDDDYIKIYVPKEYKKIDSDNFEDILKSILLKYKKLYDISLSGFYTVNVYSDKIYGSIIYMHKEDIDYYDYYDNQIDMKIIYEETEFLYQIDDYFYFNNKDYLDILFLEGKMYGKINREIPVSELAKLMEMTNIIKI